MKRTLAVLAAAGVVLGGGAVAFATTTGPDPARREAARACLDQAREANPDADPAQLREAAKPCLDAAGIRPRELTPEQKAKRQQFRECAAKVLTGNPDSDRRELRDLVRETCKR